MKCLQCGRCCFYFVTIVAPHAVRENLDLDSLTEEDMIVLDGSTKYPHLVWQEDERAFCNIHHYIWFQNTPCGTHILVGNAKSPCRIGKMYEDHPELLQPYRDIK